MTRRVATAATTSTMAIISPVFAAAIAHADRAAPQAGTPCGPAYGNAQTLSPQQEILSCVNGQWQRVDTIQRPVQTWFTYGPEATLTGDDVTPAQEWVGIPTVQGTLCSAEQTAATGGPPEVDSNKSNLNMYFDFRLIPNLATLKLSGFCNWETPAPQYPTNPSGPP
jgi:hypothetical protein